MSLAGQTALVTGGSKGIGKAICLALAKEGANVIIAARNESEIKETMNKLKAMGSKSMYRSLFSDEPVLKPEDVANKVLELCLPETSLPSGSSVEIHRRPMKIF